MREAFSISQQSELVAVRNSGTKRSKSPIPQSLENSSLRGRNGIATLHLKCNLGITLHTIHEDLEVQVGAGGKTALSNGANGAANGHVRAAMNALCKVAQVPIATDISVAMAHIDHVAVSTLAAGEDNDAVAN